MTEIIPEGGTGLGPGRRAGARPLRPAGVALPPPTVATTPCMEVAVVTMEVATGMAEAAGVAVAEAASPTTTATTRATEEGAGRARDRLVTAGASLIGPGQALFLCGCSPFLVLTPALLQMPQDVTNIH